MATTMMVVTIVLTLSSSGGHDELRVLFGGYDYAER